MFLISLRQVRYMLKCWRIKLKIIERNESTEVSIALRKIFSTHPSTLPIDAFLIDGSITHSLGSCSKISVLVIPNVSHYLPMHLSRYRSKIPHSYIVQNLTKRLEPVEFSGDMFIEMKATVEPLSFHTLIAKDSVIDDMA